MNVPFPLSRLVLGAALLAAAQAALVVVHVAAVIKHQFIDRDGLLTRMLPQR